TQALTGHSDQERDANIVPYRVIADHLRAAVFLIADGVMPGAKGRDSVCRLVIRRAARFGEKLGFHHPFLATVADAVFDIMSGHYTELIERKDAIKRVITLEEERFRRTLDRGLSELDAMLIDLPQGGTLDGQKAFYLKATLGLPIQVTKDIVEERGFHVDMAGFEAAEAEHGLRSGGGQAMGTIESADMYKKLLADLQASQMLPAEGVSYEPYGPTTLHARMIGLLVDGELRTDAIVGDKVEVILDRTPFYVEAGGQVSDTGVIIGPGWRIEIEDMGRPLGGLIVHRGEVVEGTPRVGDTAQAVVDAERRASITRNHTATHLLHAALRNHLGKHVQQRGSLVAPDRLRFDFAHEGRVSPDELRAVENEVNDIIMHNYAVTAALKPLAEARSEGAMALFGEKYGDVVRTISIVNASGDRYSYELCGGVHVRETSEIGPFLIVSEGSVSSGVRRVEALTGRGAMDYVQRTRSLVAGLAAQLGTTPETIGERLEALQNDLHAARKRIEQLQRDHARAQFKNLLSGGEFRDGALMIISAIDDATPDMLREMSDWFRTQVKSGVMVLGSISDGKPQLLATITDDLTRNGLHAGNLIKQLAPIVGGGGGGRANMAMAGGKHPEKLADALNAARDLIATALHAG
ncbi:MAG: alanine--tRNA ligase, partial [Anaerolinea sp.]|nr:alanine--tRNA ligase [Anaerolinea sp.]